MPASSHRERLYEAFSDPDVDLDQQIERGLDVGRAYLDLPIGFATHIDDGTQHLTHVAGESARLRVGETCPLDEAYCRRTVELDQPLAVQDVAESAIDPRAVDRFGLGTYIGCPVFVDDEVHGTVCFGAHERRSSPFSEAEELFLEVFARLVGTAIERRRYEEDMRERNDRLRREKRRFEGIAEASFDVIFRVDREGRFTYVSSAVERILGYEPEALVGESFSTFMTLQSTRTAAVAYSQLLRGEAVVRNELNFVTSDDEVVVVEVNATPVVEDGEVVGIQGVGRNVTEQRERQRELRIKDRAMDEARIGIVIADVQRPNNPLIYLNDGFERLTGYSTDEMLGENCRVLQGPATDEESVDRFRTAIEEEASVTVELINYRRDGTPFWNQVQLSPVENQTGSVTHYLGFQRDITERKRTDQLLLVLNRVLRHNLRNDLTALLGWGEVLGVADGNESGEGDRNGGSGGADPAEKVASIVSRLTALGDQARELEEYARRDRDPQRLDPETLVDGAVVSGRESNPGGDVDVVVDTGRAVCAGPELEHAMAELVENGLKHDPGDGRVTVRVDDDGEWVRLTVRDRGPGIGEMESAVVASGSEDSLQHSDGLGLWFVNWLVTRYGGSFQISAPDEQGGTEAVIRLPAIEADEDVQSVARRPTTLSW